MAKIFVSYTRSDRDEAFWIGEELKKLGHTPLIHEWETKAGENFSTWMRESLDSADHVLLVVSDAYLKAPYSLWELDVAVKQAAGKRRSDFVLPVLIKQCRMPIPIIIDSLNRCNLAAVPKDAASLPFREFIAKLGKPNPPNFIPDPFRETVAAANIPISKPRLFMGREDALAEIQASLERREGVAITALHGMRGVGKTVLAAAYADLHRSDYRATWWIRPSRTAVSLAAMTSRCQFIARRVCGLRSWKQRPAKVVKSCRSRQSYSARVRSSSIAVSLLATRAFSCSSTIWSASLNSVASAEAGSF